MSDEVLVLNVGGYVGDSTAREIAYAQAHGKTLRYLEPVGGHVRFEPGRLGNYYAVDDGTGRHYLEPSRGVPDSEEMPVSPWSVDNGD